MLVSMLGELSKPMQINNHGYNSAKAASARPSPEGLHTHSLDCQSPTQVPLLIYNFGKVKTLSSCF